MRNCRCKTITECQRTTAERSHCPKSEGEKMNTWETALLSCRQMVGGEAMDLSWACGPLSEWGEMAGGCGLQLSHEAAIANATRLYL
jgi:hypothetical protein